MVRVMVGSGAIDWPGYRSAVVDAVYRVGGVPLVAEIGTDPFALVDECDVYLAVVGPRYGAIPVDTFDNPAGASVPELEYRRAARRGIPVLVFLAAPSPADADPDLRERAKLAALRNELSKRSRGTFATPGELHSLVATALVAELELLTTDKPVTVAADRGRGAVPRPPAVYCVPPYTLTGTFVGRQTELRKLDEWADSNDAVMVVEAIGGMGKSAVTWEWFQVRAAERLPGLAGRMWWSFYERGTSMKEFLRHAVAYVRGDAPDDLHRFSPQRLCEMLVAAVRRTPYLFVLDGVERVLTAYHRVDKAQMRDDRVPTDQRECTNPKDGEALRHLIACGRSKVLVSTRLMPKELEAADGEPLFGVRHLTLAGLSEPDTLALARVAGVRGDGGAFVRFATEFDRHALLVRIVCGMIADYPRSPGDFDAWRADPEAGGGLKPSELAQTARHTHILQHALEGLGDDARRVLSRVAVYSDAVDYAAVAALNPFLPPKPTPQEPCEVPDDDSELVALMAAREEAMRPAHSRESIARRQAALVASRQQFARHLALVRAQQAHEQAVREHPHTPEYRDGVRRFHAALADLEGRGLLMWDRVANTYDLHPVVRATAFDRLDDDDRTDAFDSAVTHFDGLPPENVHAATDVSQVKNSVEVMRALIGGGRIDRALNFYKHRLEHGLLFSVGAYHLAIELVRPLVAHLRDPAHPDAADQASYVTNSLALALASAGRYADAADQYAEKVRIDVAFNRLVGLATGLRNLAACHTDANRPAAAHALHALARELSEALDHENGVSVSVMFAIAAAVSAGRYEEAERLIAEFVGRPTPPREVYRRGQIEYWKCRLCFHQRTLTGRQLTEANRVARQAANVIDQHRLAALRAEWELSRRRVAAAREQAEQAVAIVRRTGEPSADYLGLYAAALASGRDGNADAARAALHEGEQAWLGQSPTFPRWAAEACLALGDAAAARRWVHTAYPLAWADGPPFVRHHELEACRELLTKLDEPEPTLPPFDPTRPPPIPHEAAVRAALRQALAERRG
jgi:tetratricopeptide (TPR) repeat protein